MVLIGLGSPFLSDDSVGPRVVREIGAAPPAGVRLVEAHAGGLTLLEELAGARRAVVVDALVDPRRTPGQVVLAEPGSATHNASCSHDCTLPEALALGRALGLPLPADRNIALVGVVARDVTSLGEHLSPEVEAALPEAARTALAFLLAGETLPVSEGV